jgi:hypothetical protein
MCGCPVGYILIFMHIKLLIVMYAQAHADIYVRKQGPEPNHIFAHIHTHSHVHKHTKRGIYIRSDMLACQPYTHTSLCISIHNSTDTYLRPPIIQCARTLFAMLTITLRDTILAWCLRALTFAWCVWIFMHVSMLVQGFMCVNMLVHTLAWCLRAQTLTRYAWIFMHVSMLVCVNSYVCQYASIREYLCMPVC